MGALDGKVAMMAGASSGIGDVLDAEDIARAILYAVGQPDHVAVNEALVRPTGRRR